jgi:hypothetical protein
MIDFKGLWEAWENSLIVFHAFHGPAFPPPASVAADAYAAISVRVRFQSCSNWTGLT